MITIPDIPEEYNQTKTYFKEINFKDKEWVGKMDKFMVEASDHIIEKLNDGKLAIKDEPQHIGVKQQLQFWSNHNSGNIREKINVLSDDLKQLHEKIYQQKEEQRMREEEKRKEAAEFIGRLKKQKEEYKHKIKINQINQRLKISSFSEQALQIMKQNRQKMIEDRKRDIELRIYKHANRKAHRQEKSAENQISYWTKIREIEGKRRYQSTKVLPQLQIRHQRKDTLQINIINSRKNSIGNPYKRNKTKVDSTHDYQEIINRYLERAKARKQGKLQKSPSIPDFHENQAAISPILQNSQIQAHIMLSHNKSVRKKMGDQHLKESILKARKTPPKNQISDSNISDSIEVKASSLSISKNDILQKLESRWEGVITNLQKGKIEKEKATEMFHPIEQKLDKIDPSGTEARLRRKLSIYEELKPGKNYFYQQYYQDDFQQSSEHGI